MYWAGRSEAECGGKDRSNYAAGLKTALAGAEAALAGMPLTVTEVDTILQTAWGAQANACASLFVGAHRISLPPE